MPLSVKVVYLVSVTPYISQILDTDYQESVVKDSAIVILDVKVPG